MINGYPEMKVHMQRTILIAALLCASEAVVAQELTAEQRAACRRVLVNGVWVRRCV